jgi:glutaredoxin
LLTQEDCGHCEEAKALLERLEGEYPLSVRAVRLSSTEGQELALRGGVMFPPGLFLDGAPFSYGRVSERKLRKALSRRAPRA